MTCAQLSGKIPHERLDRSGSLDPDGDLDQPGRVDVQEIDVGRMKDRDRKVGMVKGDILAL